MKNLFLLFIFFTSFLFSITEDECISLNSSTSRYDAFKFLTWTKEGMTSDLSTRPVGSGCGTAFYNSRVSGTWFIYAYFESGSVIEHYYKKVLPCKSNEIRNDEGICKVPCHDNDIPKHILLEDETLIYDGDTSSAPSECYEPNAPIFSSVYKTDCVESMLCWRKTLPQANCSALGSGWSSAPAVESMNSTICLDLVDNVVWDSATWATSGSTSDTCCVHSKSDSNSSGGSDSNSSGGSSSGGDSDSTGNGSSGNDSNSTDSGSSSDLSDIKDLLGQSLSELTENNINGVKIDKGITDLNDKLDELTRQNNLHSDAVKSAINSANSQAHSDSSNEQTRLEEMAQALRDVQGDNHNFYRELGDLRRESNSSNNARNALLEDINKTLNGAGGSNNEDEDSEAPNRDEIDGKNSSLESFAEDAIKTFTDGFETLQAVLTGVTPPTVNYGGASSCTLAINIFGKVVSFGEGFNRILPIFRPFLLFVLNISLAFYLLKLTVFVFWDIFNRIYVSTK